MAEKFRTPEDPWNDPTYIWVSNNRPKVAAKWLSTTIEITHHWYPFKLARIVTGLTTWLKVHDDQHQALDKNLWQRGDFITI